MKAEQKSECILNTEEMIDTEQQAEDIFPIEGVLEAKPKTSAILSLEQAIEQFAQEVRPLLDPTSQENWDGEKLKSRELAILQAGLRLVGHCIAILIYQLASNANIQLAANLAATGLASFSYTSQGIRDVTITLIGGVEVTIPATYKLARKKRKGRGRKRKRGKRSKSQGQGFYPLLTLLGIGNKVSPLVRCLVAEAATQAPSFEQARPRLAWLELNFSARRIRKISEDFCQVGLMVRAQRLAELAKMPVSQVLSGKRVALAVDGGRINVRRTFRRGRKRKSGWPGYESEWKEPKLLIIYVFDEQGRKMSATEMPLVADGTLQGLEFFLELVELYLSQLGISLADQVLLLGDGAHWIWDHIPSLLQKLGCQTEQIVQILDYCHACQHLYEVGELIFGKKKGKKWAKKWKKKLKKGQVEALLNEINNYSPNQTGNKVKDIQREYNYFLNHHVNGRLNYAYFSRQGWPIGSGVVESLIRQVVNLRLKGCSKSWLKENAEAFLHARCQWAVGNWGPFCQAVLTFGLG